MKPKLTPLRKAAILLNNLDDATAEALLQQMTPAESERVRAELAALGDVDLQVQRDVVSDFRRSGITKHDPYATGIELDDSLARKLAASTPELAATSEARSDSPPFRFLHEAEADTLVQFLRDERPQVVALVVAHLEPDRAAAILDRFDVEMQGHVLHCLSHLDETDSAVLNDLQEHLHAQLREHIRLRKRQAAGAAAVSAILATVDSRKRSALVQSLAERDRASAVRAQTHCGGTRRLIPREFDETNNSGSNPSIDVSRFDHLYHLTNEELRDVISNTKSEVVVMALAGADGALVERVLKCLPPKQSRLLGRALKHLGPTRLSDVEEAQFVLAQLALKVDKRRNNKSSTQRRRALAT
jgi:flagellar motor switch protein FliG